MDKDTAQLILAFMERVNLTGKETPAFNKCVGVLSTYITTEEKVVEEIKEEE